MKKRMLLLICIVTLGSLGLESGALARALWSVGEWAAMATLSRSLSPQQTITLETGQGYEEGLFVAPAESKSESTAPVVNLSINNGKYAVTENIAIKNSTSYAVDVAALLAEGFTKPTLSKDAPAVLIYHTHTTESYADAGSDYSDDADKGVVGVGEAMKEVFESHGLQTIHLTDNYIDTGAFKQAYTRSLAGVEAVLRQYPSIQIVLDIHRDSITEGNTEYCPLTTLDGEEYAQIMVVSGSDALGLRHPTWRENLKYGLSLVAQLQTDYPGISRPLNLNANRYNTHTTPYALLVEIGGGANTSAQAKRSGRAVAESICKIVN